MPHKDIRVVRHCYASVRELVIHNPGGWDDLQTRSRVEELCRAAIAAFDDAECHARLRAVQSQAEELYSREGHRKWSRASMSGADYLRLQILITLEALNTRLFFIASQHEEVAFPGK